MASVDIPLASLDKNRTRFYLPSENLGQQFSAFPSSRYESKQEAGMRNGREKVKTGTIADDHGYSETSNTGNGCPSPPQDYEDLTGDNHTNEPQWESGEKKLEYFGDPEGAGGFASPSGSSTMSDYADCFSEANSLSSSLEEDHGAEEGMRQLKSRASGSAQNSLTTDLAVERRKRADAEAAAAELQKQHTRLQLELELLKQQGALAWRPTVTAAEALEEEDSELIVARIVAAIFARAVAAEDVAQQWKGEVELLQRRVMRMGRMEEAIERQRERDRLARSTLQRKLMHGALAVGCIAAGAFAAYLTVRWFQSSAHSRPSDMSAQSEPATVSMVDDTAAESMLAGALPHLVDGQIPDRSVAVGELISTADVLRQTALHQDILQAAGSAAGEMAPRAAAGNAGPQRLV